MSLDQLPATLVIDPTHSAISFVTRHAMVTKVRGSFEEFEGTATVGDAPRLDVTIATASIDTRNADRDAHLRSADFLDAEQYPSITFTSTQYRVDGDAIEITGDLTIKDVTRSISIPFEYQGEAMDPFGNRRLGFEGRTKIRRSDFGLTWNAALETGGFLVSDDVTLEFDVSAIAPQA